MGLQELWFIADRGAVHRILHPGGVRLRRRHADGAARPDGRRGGPNTSKPTPRRAQHDRTGVGRQRGVADHRRRRDVRRLPGLVRHGVLGAVPAAAGDPVRDDPAHRGDRMARQDRRSEVAAAGPTSASRSGSWLPAILWGVAFAILVRGLPVDADAPGRSCRSST